MCYSAMVWADYRSYTRAFGAVISIEEFSRLFKARLDGAKITVPKATADSFSEPANAAEREIQSLVVAYNEMEAARLEKEVFRQRARLADAERQLSVKETKRAFEDRRIATAKIDQSLGRLRDLKRTEARDRDGRIYPGTYVPVMVEEHGRLVVKPMRYQCRPAGRPAIYDRKYPGTYNARRDNLEGYWRDQFGKSHGIMVATSFFENVSRHRLEHRELASDEQPENVVLKFDPNDGGPMIVACLYSHWTGGAGEHDLWSFAAITDAPPPEIAAAGHDRCIIPIKRKNLGTWLRPEASLASSYAILDDRERPGYQFEVAA